MAAPFLAIALTVSAAVSLKAPVEEAARVWEESGRPGIVLSTGASGLLATQIEKGAPVDLFLGASSREVSRLERGGRIVAGSRRAIAGNRLVTVVPRGEDPPASFAALADPRYDRIAIGNPATAPVGAYAKDALVAGGHWAAVEGRILVAENSRQVLDWVARGEVAAGIVYATDVPLAAARVVVGAGPPPGAHAPIVYEGCAIAGGSVKEASAFLEFLVSPDGASIFRDHGFDPPGR